MFGIYATGWLKMAKTNDYKQGLALFQEKIGIINKILYEIEQIKLEIQEELWDYQDKHQEKVEDDN